METRTKLMKQTELTQRLMKHDSEAAATHYLPAMSSAVSPTVFSWT